MTSDGAQHKQKVPLSFGLKSKDNHRALCGSLRSILGKAVRANLFYIVTLAMVWVAQNFAQSLTCLKVASLGPNRVH